MEHFKTLWNITTPYAERQITELQWIVGGVFHYSTFYTNNDI